jgi:hypothetical protein
MGEDNMTDRTNQAAENGQANQTPDDIEEDDNDDMDDYDFVSLDLQLNELNSALDALEQKNDKIHARLIELLESNRETRQLFQKNLTDEQKLDPQV